MLHGSDTSISSRERNVIRYLLNDLKPTFITIISILEKIKGLLSIAVIA
jgi:hypothetical protein